jgi:excisionase family DNA binding protein
MEYLEHLGGNWLSVKEAAARAGCSLSWVYRLARRGKIKALQTPLGLLISAQAIEAIRPKRHDYRAVKVKGESQ